MICDGTSLGFRKDLLPALLVKSSTESLPIIYSSRHHERTFIRSVRGRELLLKYSGYSKDRRKLPIPACLSRADFQTSLKLIDKDSKATS